MAKDGSSRCFSGQNRVCLSTIIATERIVGHSDRQVPFFSPVFGQITPGAPEFFYFAQLPPIFGNVILPSGGILEQTSTDHDNI